MEATVPLLLWMALTVFIAGVATGATALGFAQIMATALALVVDARTAVLILAVTVPVISGLQVIHHRRSPFPARRLLPVLGGAFVGVPVGVFLLTVLSTEFLAGAVGLVSLLYVLTRVVRVRPIVWPEQERYLGPLAGLGGGVLNGALGLSGPVLIPYLLALRLPLPTFGYAVSVMYVSMTLFRLSGLLASGTLVVSTALLGVGLLIPALVGQRVGFVLQRRLGSEVFERIVLASLVVGATALLARAIGL